MIAALILSLVTPASAELKIEAPLPNPPKIKSHQILTQEFANARGLSDFEMRSMHYNRVACSRRIFTPSGQSVEGDGDIKVTKVGSNFLEVEFPSQITFTMFGTTNPYKNGVADVETTTSRQLINLRQWQNGQSLALKKLVTVYPEKEDQIPYQTEATVEVRVIDDSYPRLYIVRETVMTEPKFTYYFICE